MSFRVERYDGTARQWDEFAREQPGWTHFHLYGWRRVIEAVHAHECVYLAARSDTGILAAILPLVRIRSLLFGHYLVSMPYVNYGGPLGGADAIAALVMRAAEIAQRDGVRLLELRSRSALPISLSVSHRKMTVLLDLPDNPAVLWGRLGAKVRSQIRRPGKDGVEVRIGTDQVRPFFRVYSRHMRDLGTPTQPLALFEALAEQFGDDFWIVCAYLAGKPIACGAGFRWADEFEITWASALREHKALAANMLVYWTIMERAIADGARVFNFGRCSVGTGTHRFKLQWGGREEPLWWYQRGTMPEASTPSPDDHRYALAQRVWRRLPYGLATSLGPSVVRGIP